MSRKLLSLLLLTGLGLISSLTAQSGILQFPAPQYMLPMYDAYSVNILGVEALGRGNTTVTAGGGAEAAVHNPAALQAAKGGMYIETAIKPPIREFNKLNEQTYTSPIPFAILGANANLFKNIKGAISYNMPKSIRYDNFTIQINQGNAQVIRYPAYYLHQFTGTLAGKWGDFNLGLNLHNQLHSFRDVTVFHKFESIDRVYYMFRLQPGIIYQHGPYSLGAAFEPETSRDMNFKYVNYHVTLPMQIKAGGAYEFTNNKLYAEGEWEQFSRMDPKFNDRLTLKAGYEKRIRDITYRAGLMSIAGVYKGAYQLPVFRTQNVEELQWWDQVDSVGVLKDASQLIASIGFSYYFKGGKLTLGVNHDLAGHVPTTQFGMALGVNFDTFKGKRFLIFDK